MKLIRATFMRPMLLLIVLAGHVAQLTLNISQLFLKPGEGDIGEKGRGNSGKEKEFSQ